MRVLAILLGSLFLAGCSSLDLSSEPPEPSTPPEKIQAVNSFSPNPRIATLSEQLKSEYASGQVHVLQVGNELKVTYPSDVLFGVGGEELLPDSQNSLDILIKAASVYPQTKVRVDCFTDKSGSAEKNLVHSQERAQSVAVYLAANGIPQEQITLQGYGSEHPVASNETAEGRAANRRVVITLKVPAPPPVV